MHIGLRTTANSAVLPQIEASRSGPKKYDLIAGHRFWLHWVAFVFAPMLRGSFRLKMLGSLTTEGLRACGSQESYRRASGKSSRSSPLAEQ
jgi:hypothetical protein